ncbi:MAG: hypothetical protein JWM26_2534 [Betaproteobacteria bacterium]|nr:hypothetical protein [Betaproteobacteria bacterium]
MTASEHAKAPAIPRGTVIAVIAVVAVTTMAQVASVMGIAVFPVIAPRLAAEMGIPSAMIGYQISLIFGTETVFSPLMSFAVTRWGACRTTQVGLGCCVAAMALALTSSLAALAATSMLLGTSMTLMTPASTHLLFRFSPARNRNLIFSIKQTGVPMTCCIVIAFLHPGWPGALIGAFFVIFGAAGVGWNGLFLAEVARSSPRGMVSVATSAAMTWNFAGILLGPAVFATVFKFTGSYTLTYGLLSLVALCGVLSLLMSASAGRRV